MDKENFDKNPVGENNEKEKSLEPIENEFQNVETVAAESKKEIDKTIEDFKNEFGQDPDPDVPPKVAAGEKAAEKSKSEIDYERFKAKIDELNELIQKNKLNEYYRDKLRKGEIPPEFDFGKDKEYTSDAAAAHAWVENEAQNLVREMHKIDIAKIKALIDELNKLVQENKLNEYYRDKLRKGEIPPEFDFGKDKEYTSDAAAAHAWAEAEVKRLEDEIHRIESSDIVTPGTPPEKEDEITPKPTTPETPPEDEEEITPEQTPETPEPTPKPTTPETPPEDEEEITPETPPVIPEPTPELTPQPTPEKTRETTERKMELENIDISPELVKEVLEKSNVLAELKELLRGQEGTGIEGLSSSIVEVLKKYFDSLGLKLTPEQQQTLDKNISKLANEVALDVYHSFESALDYQAKEKVGFWKKMRAKITKFTGKQIATTLVVGVGAAALAPLFLPYFGIAAGVGAVAMTGGVAGGARALVGRIFGKKRKDRAQEEAAEIETKERENICAAKEKILDEGIERRKGEGKRDFISIDSLSSVIANKIRNNTNEKFRQGDIMDKEGNINKDVARTLHQNIMEYVHKDPKFEGLSEKELKLEAKKLFSLYSLELIQRKQILEISKQRGGDSKALQQIEKIQKILGGDLTVLKKEQDQSAQEAYSHVLGSIAIGAGTRVALQSSKAVSAFIGAFAGGAMGFKFGEHLEKRAVVEEYYQTVEDLVDKGEPLIRDILKSGDLHISQYDDLEQDVMKVQGYLGLMKADNTPMIEDNIIRSRAEEFVHQFNKLKQLKYEQETVRPEAEYRFSDRLKGLNDRLEKEENELVDEITERVNTAAGQARFKKYLLTAGGVALGGSVGYLVGEWREARQAAAASAAVAADSAAVSEQIADTTGTSKIGETGKVVPDNLTEPDTSAASSTPKDEVPSAPADTFRTAVQDTTTAPSDSTRVHIGEGLDTNLKDDLDNSAGVIDQGPIPPDQTVADTVVTNEHVKYQGGKHVWGEVEKQLQARQSFKGHFAGLSPEEKTHAIDFFKDRVVKNPQDYGLPAGTNVDNLTREQLASIKWDEVFAYENIDQAAAETAAGSGEASPDDFQKKWGPTLPDKDIANIRQNNAWLKEWVQKTGSSIESDKVDKLLADIKKAGSVDEYLKVKDQLTPEKFRDLKSIIPEKIEIGNILEEFKEEFKQWTADGEGLDKLPSKWAAIPSELKAQYIMDNLPPDELSKAQQQLILDIAKNDPNVFDRLAHQNAFGEEYQKLDSGFREKINNILNQDMNQELTKGSILMFGGPDGKNLEANTILMARSQGLSEGQSKLFAGYLSQGKEMNKSMFKEFMEGKEFDNDKFKTKLEDFNKELGEATIPEKEEGWVPRMITNDNGEKQEALVREYPDKKRESFHIIFSDGKQVMTDRGLLQDYLKVPTADQGQINIEDGVTSSVSKSVDSVIEPETDESIKVKTEEALPQDQPVETTSQPEQLEESEPESNVREVDNNVVEKVESEDIEESNPTEGTEEELTIPTDEIEKTEKSQGLSRGLKVPPVEDKFSDGNMVSPDESEGIGGEPETITPDKIDLAERNRLFDVLDYNLKWNMINTPSDYIRWVQDNFKINLRPDLAESLGTSFDNYHQSLGTAEEVSANTELKRVLNDLLDKK